MNMHREGLDFLAGLLHRPLDWAKVGAALYTLGILITSLYFLRFSILSLDLLRPQSIFVGAYFLLLYIGLPQLFLILLTPVRWSGVVLAAFVVLLVTKELLLLLLISAPPGAGSALLVGLQVVMFARIRYRRDRAERRNPSLRFEVFPRDGIAAVSLALILVVFASSLYGRIPGYLGGGRPLLVQLFTKTPELPSNRFMRTRNMPQINRKLPSFKLQLLYETEDYLYFLAESSGQMKGYSIMKIKRDEVLRVDYVTPVWFALGEGGDE